MVGLEQSLMQQRAAWWYAEGQRVVNKAAVLLVEGADDQDRIEAVLDGVAPHWPAQLAVVPLYGREAVKKHLQLGQLPFSHRLPQRVVALVDRDGRDDAEVRAERAAAGPAGRLLHTPGWCLENSLVVAACRRVAVEAADRAPWVDAGALGWAWQRSIGALRQGVPPWRPEDIAGLTFSDAPTLAAGLLRHRQGWFDAIPSLGAGPIADLAVARRLAVVQWSDDEQWLNGVHGKHAFRALFTPRLNQGAPQRSAERWALTLARSLGSAPWVAELATALGL